VNKPPDELQNRFPLKGGRMSYSSILFLHISGGAVGMLSGATAMFFRKGSRGHILAGQVFVAAMLTMASAGTYMAIVKSQTGNIMGGLVTLYMISTAWATARRREGETGLFEWAAFAAVLTIFAAMLTFGIEAVRSPTGTKGGYGPPIYFIWSAITLSCALGDLRVLARRGLFGTQRMVRHLWRMCFGLFIAAGSFFLGQQKVFPVYLRGLKIWFVPAFLPLLLLIYWMIRVRWTKEYQRKTPEVGKNPEAVKLLPLTHAPEKTAV
jgi:uncharacterized membrane protein